MTMQHTVLLPCATFNFSVFMELEDLSRNFVDPCIMDIKMGTRTFLESEVQNQKKRPDLYDKMIAIDPEEPSASEHEEKAITKLRYMTVSYKFN